MRKHINAQSNNKGLLVVSFGTTHKDTCEETIGAIEEHLAKAMPARSLYRAWTSRFIIKKLRERDGTKIDTIEEALERMSAEGIEDVLVVPTHMLAGAEYDKVEAAVKSLSEADRPERIATSRPLLDSDGDLKRLAEVIAGELLSADDPQLGADDPRTALVLMGHGSADKPEVNEIYVRLETEFHKAGHTNVFVGTVEGEPGIDTVIDKVRSIDPLERVLLAPLMIVAGDHAVRDMAGEDPDSWKNQIAEATGPATEVIPILRGLGSYAGVRDMFVEHAALADTLVTL